MARDTAKYQFIAEQLALDIRAKRFAAGARLPGTRPLAKRFAVSNSTIVAAQQLLERQGLIVARARSGFYVRPSHNQPPPAELRSSPKLSLAEQPRQVLSLIQQANDANLLSLGAAVPDPALLPLSTVSHQLRAVARATPSLLGQYQFPPGDLLLRQALSRQLLQANCQVDADEVLITSGCHEALTLALAACCKQGDIVAVESPCYYGLWQILSMLGLQAVEIPSQATRGIDLAALAQAAKRWSLKACVLVTNFSNPLGVSLSDADKRQLVDFCAAQQITLVENDIYGELAFYGTRPVAAKSFDNDAQVIYCSSSAKTLGPGLRVGWMVAGKHHDAVLYQKFSRSLSAPALMQRTLAQLLPQRRYQQQVDNLRRQLRDNAQRMIEQVLRDFPQGSYTSEPQGGFVLWITLPEQCDALQLQQLALAHGISIAPGPLFSAQQRFGHHLRLSFALPWNQKLTQAISTLGRLAHQCLRPN